MNTPDDFSQYHAELLDGIYDCVDRIVLNAFFPLGQTGGGMRSWWRSLHGDDSQLDDKHLREMAGTFSRRLHAFCGKHGIPIIEARSRERKHELAEPHVPKDPTFRGLFLVITGNAPAPTWEVKRNSDGRITEVRHRKNWPLVKHYYTAATSFRAIELVGDQLAIPGQDGVGLSHSCDLGARQQRQVGTNERRPGGRALALRQPCSCH